MLYLIRMITLRDKRGSENGLTLIEILLALIIFVVLAGGTFYVFETARAWAGKNQHRLFANALAQETLEFLENTVTANASPGSLPNNRYFDRDPATAVGTPPNFALNPGVHQDPLPADHPLLTFAGSRSYLVEILNPSQISAAFPDSLSGAAVPDYQMRRARVTVHWTEPAP